MANIDYSLTGVNASRAVEMGLAEADWYQPPLPRATLRKLLERRDGPAIRDTLLLLTILASSAYVTMMLWGTWWAAIPYLIYAVFYATASDSRWHECSHGTAFKTDWMNNALYEVASFMVMRESVVWRWSHNRHHSDTIVVGRDPEIQIPRPPDLKALVLSLVCYGNYRAHYASVIRHALGSISDVEQSFVPESEHPKVIRNARMLVTIYTLIVLSAIALQSWIPIFLFILPHFFGTWVMIVQNTPQHAGLAENVLDHRLNSRTIYMNPISRFIYWNMNYHLEHHLFPLVPYHALPKLHEALKEYCPPPYPSILSAWRELLPALRRQAKDPGYFVKRELPEDMERTEEGAFRANDEPDVEGWLAACDTTDLKTEDVIRFDHKRKTFALYRIASGELFATDGVCTHGNTHLGNGLVRGELIECPKHNGRFNLRDGSPARAPICRGLATYPVEERDGCIWLNVENAGGSGARIQKTIKLRVVSNTSVATFIKELVLESVDASEQIEFTPGDYIQLDIPEFDQIRFSDFDIPEPFAAAWRKQNVFELTASNNETGRRNNYSLANNVATDHELRFNVRIATSPQGQDCPPGVGSAYVFNLKPGDEISAIGPCGDFHIKPTQKEMVYIGGGAGMAPLRAHILQLFENDGTQRKVSYWYGARSRQEIFYEESFRQLADTHHNFDFHLALSDPLDEDDWHGKTGFIHEVVLAYYLKHHPNPRAVEYYLCGPPALITACTAMLTNLGVTDEQIAFDEF